MRLNKWQEFLQLESSSGIILFVMAVLAMLWANSPLAFLHQRFTETFLFTINDGLMTLFFLVVGLELKRGFISGQLSKASQIMLPALAALGGMLVPAGIYWLCNHANSVGIKGWSIPVATDIAFAVSMLSLFGRRIPEALKLFLLALAIFDDLGAIIIIALFYSHGLSCSYLFLSGILVLTLYLFNKFAVTQLAPYLLLGVGLWFCLFYSGVHPTIAGVLLALTIPARRIKGEESLLQVLEAKLHPYVAYLVIPLFALANAGFSLQGLSWHTVGNTVVLGIVLGLVMGKQVGVFGFSWLLIRLRGAKLPANTSWAMLYGVAILCGIGFTMSLFLGTLSFQNENTIYVASVRLGVIIGSILSGCIGAVVLLFAKGKYS